MFAVLAIFALVSPFISLIFISIYYLQYKKTVKSSVLFGMSSAACFYNYIPDSGNDSIRHMMNLHFYAEIPFWKCFDAGYYSQTYIWDVWSWIVAQFKLPYLLPATGAFIGYTITAYLVFDYCKQINASKGDCTIAILLTALMTSPIGIVVGIRNSNAFLICMLGMYLCEVKHRNKVVGFALILCGVFIHHSALLVLVMWLIFPFFKKSPKICGLIVAIAILSLTIISNYVLKNMSGSNWVFSMIVDAFNGVSTYQMENNYNVAVAANTKYKIESLISIGMIVLMLFRSMMPARKVSITSSKDIAENEVYNTVKQLSLLFTIVTFALMTVLLINGGRYSGIASKTAFLSMIYSYRYAHFLPKKNGVLLMVDIAVLVGIAIEVILSIYTLSWGSASIGSLLGGLFGGGLYSVINTI